MTRDVNRPQFTFRLERIRALREREEDQAKEEYATSLRERLESAALLEAARERSALDRLRARRAAEHGRAAARRESAELDELAIRAHRRRQVER